MKRAERWVLCGAIAVAALVFVLALATRDESSAAEAMKPVDEPSDNVPAAQTLIPASSTPPPTAQSTKSEPASPLVAKPRVEPSKTHGTIAVRLHAGYEPRPEWIVRLTASVVGAGDEKRVTFEASLASQIIYFDGVWPGDVLLSVDCEGCVPQEMHVPVKVGFTKIVDIQLDCRPPPGWIDVTVRSQSGKFNADIDVWSGELDRLGSIAWAEEDGRFVGRCFCDLSSKGEVELTFMPSHSEFGLAPSNRMLARPGQVIALVVQDLAPRIALGFRVVDEQTNAELDDFGVDWNRMISATGKSHVHSGDIVLENVPEGGTLTWEVSKPGYACAEGTLQQASLIADGNNRWIQVALRRGRVLRVNVYGCSEGVIAGATVLADGIEIGRTNDYGQFKTFLPEPPKSVDVRHLGWTHCRNPESAPRDVDKLSPCATLFFHLMRN